MLSHHVNQQFEDRQKLSMAIVIVFLMLASSLLAMVQSVQDQAELPTSTRLVEGGSIGMTPVQSTDQGGQGGWEGSNDGGLTAAHEALANLMWSDPGVSSGIIVDLSVLEAALPAYATLLEESRAGDHDTTVLTI